MCARVFSPLWIWCIKLSDRLENEESTIITKVRSQQFHVLCINFFHQIGSILPIIPYLMSNWSLQICILTFIIKKESHSLRLWKCYDPTLKYRSLKSRRKTDHFSLPTTITFTLQRNWCNIILHRSNKKGTLTIFCIQRFGCNNNARQLSTKHQLKTKVNQLFLFFRQRARYAFICSCIFSKHCFFIDTNTKTPI